MSRPFAAKFAGRCHAGDDIRVGDEVTFINVPGHDDTSVLVHVGCETDITQSAPRTDPGPYCGACFTFHRGDCL